MVIRGCGDTLHLRNVAYLLLVVEEHRHLLDRGEVLAIELRGDGDQGLW